MKRLGVVLVLGLLLAVPVAAQTSGGRVDVGGYMLTLPDGWSLPDAEFEPLYEVNSDFEPTVLVHVEGLGAIIVSPDRLASQVSNINQAELPKGLNLAFSEAFSITAPDEDIDIVDLGEVDSAIYNYENQRILPGAVIIGTMAFMRLADGAPVALITYTYRSYLNDNPSLIVTAEYDLFRAVSRMPRTLDASSFVDMALPTIATGELVLPDGWAFTRQGFRQIYDIDGGDIPVTILIHETGLVAMVASPTELLARLPELRDGVTFDLFWEIWRWDNEGHYQGDGFSYFKQVVKRDAVHFPYLDEDVLPGTDIHGEMYLIETDSVPLFVWFYARRDAFDLEGLTMERAQHLLLYALTRNSVVPTCSISAKSESVSMHVGPSRERAVFGYLPQGEQFLVSSRAVDAAGEAWYRIDPLDIAPDVPTESLWVAEADLSLGDRFCRQLSMPDDFVPIERAWWLNFDNTIHLSCQNGTVFWRDQNNTVSDSNTLSFLNSNEQGIFFHATQFVRQPDGSYVGVRYENLDNDPNTTEYTQTYRMFFEGENHSTGIASYAFEANGVQCERSRAFIATTD
jgi:hypothetical protein